MFYVRRAVSAAILAVMAVLFMGLSATPAQADHSGVNIQGRNFGFGFSARGNNDRRRDSDFERGFALGLRSSRFAQVRGNSDFARGFRAGQRAAQVNNSHGRGVRNQGRHGR